MQYSWMSTSIEPPYYGMHSLAVNRNLPFPLPHPLSYIGCCRAVLTEVYEGLMLPLPPELYCSPATNPTLDSSDSDVTPLRSLQEPAAPKMVTGNAKRYDFYIIFCQKGSWKKSDCNFISFSLVRHTSFQVQKQIAVKKQKKTKVRTMCNNSLVPHKNPAGI